MLPRLPLKQRPSACQCAAASMSIWLVTSTPATPLARRPIVPLRQMPGPKSPRGGLSPVLPFPPCLSTTSPQLPTAVSVPLMPIIQQACLPILPPQAITAPGRLSGGTAPWPATILVAPPLILPPQPTLCICKVGHCNLRAKCCDQNPFAIGWVKVPVRGAVICNVAHLDMAKHCW